MLRKLLGLIVFVERFCALGTATIAQWRGVRRDDLMRGAGGLILSHHEPANRGTWLDVGTRALTPQSPG